MEYQMMDYRYIFLKEEAKYCSLEYRTVKLLKEREETFQNRRLSMIQVGDENGGKKIVEGNNGGKRQNSREDDLIYFDSQLNVW